MIKKKEVYPLRRYNSPKCAPSNKALNTQSINW